MEYSNDSQMQSHGLYVKPAPPRKEPSKFWKVIRWLFVICLAGVCLVSVFFNVIISSLLPGGMPVDGKIVEKHVSGPSLFAAAAKVAIVSVDGVIMGNQESGSAAWIVKQLDKAQSDADVKTILLDVNSPGGGITASDIIYKKILDLQAEPYGKKVIVLMGDVAASGAYYISASADEIFAHPTTITGSIGVLISSLNAEGLMDKIGIESVVFKSAPQKDMLSFYRAPTEEEKVILQSITDEMFDRFKTIVMDGRGLTQAEADAAATGSIFTASQAKELKLVDAIGYYEDAVGAAISATGMTQVAVVRYERPPTLADHLFGADGSANSGVEEQLMTLFKGRPAGFYYLWTGP